MVELVSDRRLAGVPEYRMAEDLSPFGIGQKPAAIGVPLAGFRSCLI